MPVAVLGLAGGYVAASGPAFYLVGRDWMPRAVYSVAFKPLSPLAYPDHPPGRAFCRYISWWYDLGWDHSGRTLPKPT